MSSKRQHGKLQNIHTRIPIKDYQTIQLICNQLKISQAEYFNSCIHQFGYERLLLYARKSTESPVLAESIFRSPQAKKSAI